MVCVSVMENFILMLTLVMMSSVALASAPKGKIGVDYGLNGDNLPPPEQVVALICANGISRVRVFEARPNVTRAFANSGIDLTIGVPNQDVAKVGASLREALSWVSQHVLPFPTSGISAIIVGNGWLSNASNDPSLLVPAMRNIYTALSALGILDLSLLDIKVSTSHAFSVINSPSFPPSNATFVEGVVAVMRPLIKFLIETGSFFMVDNFPYLTYLEDLTVPLEFILFESTEPVEDPNTGLNYTNLFDVQLDAVYSAIASLMESASPPPPSSPSLPCGCKNGDEDASSETVSAQTSKNSPQLLAKRGKPVRPTIYNGATGHPHAQSGNYVVPGGGHALKRNGTSNHKGKGRYSWPARQYSRVSECNCDADPATVEIAHTYNQNLIQHVLQAKGTPAHPTTPIQANIFELFDEDLNPPPLQNYGFFFPNGTPIYPLQFHL